jgi:hypothetical protein
MNSVTVCAAATQKAIDVSCFRLHSCACLGPTYTARMTQSSSLSPQEPMSWQLYNDFFFYLFGGTASLQSLQSL